MSNNSRTVDDNEEISDIRQNLVETAVNFLLNPAVIEKPSAHKTAFLKKKGLTDAEIALAFEKSESSPKYKEFQRNGPPISSAVAPPPVTPYQRPVPFWSQISRLTSSVVVVGAAIFGAHYVYKNFIEPFLFGGDRKKDEKSIAMHLELTTKSLIELEKKLTSLEERVNCQNSQISKVLQNENTDYFHNSLRELKVEIGSLKPLLLSRNQFPSLPKVTSPSIPEWQLAIGKSSSAKEDKEEDLTKDPSSSPESLCPSDESFVRVESDEKDRTISSQDNEVSPSEFLDN